MAGETIQWRLGTDALLSCPRFGPWVGRIGPVPYIEPKCDHFAALVRTIVYQQLAGKAAETIHGRVVEALGGTVDSDSIMGSPDEILRGAGLSRNKLAAVRDLAAKVGAGEVTLDLDDLEDEEVIQSLVQVRGIGRWTAEMFLMFQLRRPDVWPVADLGVRKGWALVHEGGELPSPKELLSLGEGYRPHRSAVAWYCYRALDLDEPAA